jgi:hypothetical protein
VIRAKDEEKRPYELTVARAFMSPNECDKVTCMLITLSPFISWLENITPSSPSKISEFWQRFGSY